MKSIIHTANSRGHANHGWLNSYHTFSFANYYDQQRMSFGLLRVLNDDTVAPGMGFSEHPHQNMEIISIPLAGDLRHKDSMGNETIIREGDIQVMSAGTGVVHSEMNHNHDKEVKFLQIWIFPDKQNVEPRYDQISIKELEKEDGLFEILSPNKDGKGVWIHQQSWFNMGKFNRDWQGSYELNVTTNGVYVFVLEGQISIDDQTLNRRDGLGIWETDRFNINAEKGSKFLLMEIPM